jgi:hypothetical protein
MTDTNLALRLEFAAVVIPDMQAELDRIRIDLDEARDIDVCSAAMAEEAQELAGRIMSVHDKFDDQRLILTKPLRDGTKRVNEGFEGALATMKGVVDDVKEKLRGWNKQVAERKRIADAEAAKKQREAAAAIEAQAKIEREAAQRLQAQAEAARAAGDAEAAQDLFEQAGSAMDSARIAESAANSVATAPVRTAVAASGVKGARKVWKCRVTDKARLLVVIANRPELYGLVEFSESAMNALAKTNQGNVPIPGLEFYEDDVIATRRA